MNKRVFLVSSLSLLLMLVSFFSPFSYVMASDVQKSESEIKDIQQDISNDIKETTKYEYSDEFTEGLDYTEEKEILIDDREDANKIKKSLSEPVTIYKEVITRTYELPDDSNSLMQSSTYKTKQTNETRTYNGVATTLHYTIGYDFIADAEIPGDPAVDAYRLKKSEFSYSAQGDAHVAHVEGIHHQRGVDLNNKYQIVFDGNSNSSNKTDKSFSISSSSGSANWSRTSNTTYSCLVSSGDTGGAIGSFYTVSFTWPEGGSGHGHDTIEEPVIFGQLPS